MLECSYDAGGNLRTQISGGISPPQIIGQPAEQIVEPGQVATFSVTLADALGASFQWQRNDSDIPSAVGDSLILTDVNKASEAVYTVIVTNSAGAVTSDRAQLMLDSDGNGLPDIFEGSNFGQETGTESEGDMDHDGISNLDEFLDGTDLRRSSSQKPRLTVYSDAGGSVAVSPMKLSYELLEAVTLTATAFAPSGFTGWSGDIGGITDPMTNPVQITLTQLQSGVASRIIRAKFASAIRPPPRLIAWWRGESDATDSIGGHDGTFFAGDVPTAPTVIPSGKVGGAFSFDGTVHVRVPASPTLKPPQLTVEAWILPTGISQDFQATIFAHGSSTGANRTWFLARLSNGSFASFPPSDLLVRGHFEPIPLNQWTHLALSFDGTTMRIYVNGAQVAWQSGLPPLAYDPADVPLTIGSDWTAGASSSRFIGLIDEVALYSRALTPTEVFDIYSADRLGKDFTRPYFTSPAQLKDAPLGAAYTQSLQTVLGTPPIVFSLTDRAPPPGITLSSTGVLSGSSNERGVFEFTVRAKDVFGQSTEQQCLLRVQ